MDHHEVLRRFDCWSGHVPAGVKVNFLGALTREDYTTFLPRHDAARYVETQYPPACEDYLQYIDVLTAVADARDRFTMVELGAGYGRWLVNAAVALRRSSGLPCHLVGIEAEPTHFAWMHAHFRDNGLDPAEHDLRQVAIAATPGEAEFLVGQPGDCYAQTLAGTARRMAASRTNGGLAPPFDALQARNVATMSVEDLLVPHDRVDLVHVDIQGAEADVLEPAITALSACVRLVHVGTHGQDLEERLRRLFEIAGWQCIHDYPCAAIHDTPWGAVEFEDGIQSWRNPRAG